MNMLSLFSGIGGIDIAAQNAGMKVVGFCEIDPFCQKVLRRHWSDVSIFSDVKKINKKVLANAKIPNIDIICGGFPCQPFSTANSERKGLEDERNLFPEIIRIASEIRPSWIVGENVKGFQSLGLDTLLTALEEINYAWKTFNIPACGVAAPHKRERIFVVANAIGYGWTENHHRQERTFSRWVTFPRSDSRTWNERMLDKPGICRVVDGIPSRVDKLTKSRLKALGNAVVPQQIYPILKCIKKIDDWVKDQKKDGLSTPMPNPLNQ